MDTPDFFVGSRLGAARLKAGISLEKAAKDTRIRVQRLREIESDDFSGFAHPTYSRLFLLDYAEYLGISQDEIRPLLPDRAGAAGGGFQYIEALSRQPSSPVVPTRSPGSRFLWLLIATGLCLILVAAGLFAYYTVKKIERVAGSSTLSTKTGSREAAPTPAPSPEEPPPPSPTPAPPDDAPSPPSLFDAPPPPLEYSLDPAGRIPVAGPTPPPVRP